MRAKHHQVYIGIQLIFQKPALSIQLFPGCFSQVVKSDTALLQMENNKGNVTGALTYDFYQKDRNDGTLQAEQTGDIINGWYLFKSEGIMSVRQVAWKINGNELWPAIGEVD